MAVTRSGSDAARLVTLALVGWLTLPAGAGQSRQVPQAPTFRSRVTLVPIDVRVLDRNGAPITDLRKEDFIIEEDGVPQQISHFLRQTLVARESDAGTPPVRPPTETLDLKPQDRRVFLIVLGLNARWLPTDVFGTAKAIARFLREQLLPQDYAGFLAWRNATDITADHEAVAQVVERLRAYELSLERRRDIRPGLLAQYIVGARPLPPEMKAELDAVFQPATQVPRSAPLVASRDIRDLLAQQEYHLDSIYKPIQPISGRLVRHFTGTSTIYTGLEYLRNIEGEKHLVLVEPGGIKLPAVDDDRNLARLASDARVVIHMICTDTFDPFASMSTKHIAELTGGQALLNQYPDRALARIDQATRVGYVLGYYPANATLDGRHRKVTVRVKRSSGLTVLYRHSYQATNAPTRSSQLQFIVQDQIMAAGEYPAEIRDIPLTLKASAKKGAVATEVLVNLSRLDLREADGRRVGKFEVAFFCADSNERLIGQLWHTVDLNLKEETYTRLLVEGLRHSVDIPITGTAGYVKVVVYDYRANRLGSAIVRLQ